MQDGFADTRERYLCLRPELAQPIDVPQRRRECFIGHIGLRALHLRMRAVAASQIAARGKLYLVNLTDRYASTVEYV